jgi:hypothetical protein
MVLLQMFVILQPMLDNYKILLNYGSIAGVIAFAVFVLLNLLGLNPLGNSGWLITFIPIYFIFQGASQQKKIVHNGLMDYKKGFFSCLTIGVVYSSLYAMLLYLYGSFIDASFIENFMQETAEEFVKNKDSVIKLIGENFYDQSLEEILNVTVGKQARAEYFNKFLFSLLSSLIIAGYLKSKTSNPFQEVEN